jgi:hypothetical protein
VRRQGKSLAFAANHGRSAETLAAIFSLCSKAANLPAVRRSVKFSVLLTTRQPWGDNLRMKVNISIQTIEKIYELLHKYDATTEQFITDLSSNDKYEILALIMMVRNNYEDFEEAHYAAKNKIPEQGLTNILWGVRQTIGKLCNVSCKMSLQSKSGTDGNTLS